MHDNDKKQEFDDTDLVVDMKRLTKIMSVIIFWLAFAYVSYILIRDFIGWVAS